MTGNRSGVKRENLFQMYAYLTKYDHIHTTILLYPQQLTLSYGTSIPEKDCLLILSPLGILNEEKERVEFVRVIEYRKNKIDFQSNDDREFFKKY
ncbi:hypothetical protein [Bacillus cereus]|uniref:hypothetical protein n=1 Tax=Bacillus cereus TaxID=1396 RepID=UPI00241426C1|nr:hypothetical protein [Bacillus cereus]